MKVKVKSEQKSVKNGEDGTRSLRKEEETLVLKNQLARALADYDNLRKRVEAERDEFTKFSNFRLVVKLLNIYDMFNEAQKHLKDSGIAIAIREFESVLDDEGIEKVPVEKGDSFDENLHEAVEIVEGGSEGKISEVLLSGWKYKDGKIIRHAKVRVLGKGGKN